MRQLLPLLAAPLARLPRACAGCDQNFLGSDGFCPICRPTVFTLRNPCKHCALPTPATRQSDTCQQCFSTPLPFQEVMAFFEYSGSIQDALCRLKYGSDLQAFRSLCHTLRPLLTTRQIPRDAPVYPIPSHPRDLRRRGFHVPSLLAKELATSLPSTPPHGVLRKISQTHKQASLGYSERHRNVKGAFSWYGPDVPGGPALLIDDVLTTGATASEAANVLLDAGYDEIYLFVIARAILFS